MRVQRPTPPPHLLGGGRPLAGTGRAAAGASERGSEPQAAALGTVPLAYLASRYPAVSHTFILREVRRLRALGLTVHTASINAPGLAPDGPTDAEREELAHTLYVKRAGAGAIARAHLATLLRRPLRYLSGLATALRTGGADLRALLYAVFYFGEAVVVGHWMERVGARHLHVYFANTAAHVGRLVARVFDVTWSLSVHGPDVFYDVSGGRLREKLADAHFACCIGHYARSQLMLLSDPRAWDKLEVCRLGVDTERFAPRAAPPPLGGRALELLCVGRLTPAKGQHVLLDAVARLVAQGRDVALRLVGDGPDRAALERHARAAGLAARCTFAGAVNEEHVRAFYAAADVFVLPSFAEGIPVVLMEAMAMEVPCVTTAITGIPELIRPERDGLLVPPSDVEALAAAIARLADDDALRARLARSGRERVLAAFDLGRNTEHLARVLVRRLAALHPHGAAGPPDA